MTDSNISISKQVVIVVPQPSTAFPISSKEWLFLKSKISRLQQKRSFVMSIIKDLGMLFIGVALTAFISLWVPGYPSLEAKLYVWLVIIFSFLFGGALTIIKHQKDKAEGEKLLSDVSHLLEDMNLIESRWDGSD